MRKQEKVAARCSLRTSLSRKSRAAVFKELNTSLFYPVQYSLESERNVFYNRRRPPPRMRSRRRLPMKDKGEALGAAGTDYV